MQLKPSSFSFAIQFAAKVEEKEVFLAVSPTTKGTFSVYNEKYPEGLYVLGFGKYLLSTPGKEVKRTFPD